MYKYFNFFPTVEKCTEILTVVTITIINACHTAKITSAT